MNLNMFVMCQCLSCILLSVVVSSVMSLFVLSHSCLSALEPPCPLPPCPQNSNDKYPQALCFSVQRTILALGIPKSPLWYTCRLSMSLTVGFFLSDIMESRQQVSPQCISRQDCKNMGYSCQHLLHVSTTGLYHTAKTFVKLATKDS